VFIGGGLTLNQSVVKFGAAGKIAAALISVRNVETVIAPKAVLT